MAPPLNWCGEGGKQRLRGKHPRDKPLRGKARRGDPLLHRLRVELPGVPHLRCLDFWGSPNFPHQSDGKLVSANLVFSLLLA